MPNSEMKSAPAAFRVALGVLCAVLPLLVWAGFGVGFSLAVCVLGFGLIASMLLGGEDEQELHNFF